MFLPLLQKNSAISDVGKCHEASFEIALFPGTKRHTDNPTCEDILRGIPALIVYL